MGFLSFHEKYYAQALDQLEGRRLDESGIYEAKQLLKLLDDLLDEGYTALADALENKYHAVSRLKELLARQGERPFPVQKRLDADMAYGQETKLETVCEELTERAAGIASPSGDPFLRELRCYCEWIGWRPGTAYVFLLRDTFLPYLYYRVKDREGLYPWVINRRFLWQLAGQGADDALRLPVYEALESGVTDHGAFTDFCKSRIRAVLKGKPALEKALHGLLDGLKEEKVLVVESGYCGTIPLTLAALDARMEMRMYTTAPYLYETYREQIFCRRYERLRSFETLHAQESLMQYARFRDGGGFYVRPAAEEAVWERAAGELAGLLVGG